jgi:hypothetical protein
MMIASVLADNDTDKGSPIGLFVVLILIVAVYFLYRSMNRHIRGLPATFDPTADLPSAAQDGSAASFDAAPPTDQPGTAASTQDSPSATSG